MISLALYFVKVIICSGILFGYYWLMLRNKIFHQYNRFYLLASILLALALPLVEINIWPGHGSAAPAAIKILQAVSSKDYLDAFANNAPKNNIINAEQVLLPIYAVTCIIFLLLFIAMLAKIRLLFTRHRHSIVDNIYVVNTVAHGTPFSFLKYIFWNDLIDPATPTGRQIFKHELAHVRQKHSFDKLFIQAVLVVCWCNPFFWMIRRELNMIHEFVADKIAVEDSDTEAFAAMILQATYPRHHFQLTNPFFYSPIKRRLVMLTKNKNPKAGYIGRVLVLPLTVLIFAAFTFKTNTIKNDPAAIYNGKKITVVLDAGHGGEDKGALSLAGNISEKDLNLSIIKKIKALNRNANINIVLTRESDITQSLVEKVKFTKEQKADLFISVHMDGATEEKAAVLSGMSVWIAKNNYANSAGSKLFASAIIHEFSNNYKLPVAGHPQQQETGIKVLQESPCPSVLIEAGYITNSNDLAFLTTDAAKEIIAGKILAAITNYAFAKDKGGAAVQMTGVESTESALTGLSPVKKIDTVPVVSLKPIEKALIIIDGKTSSQSALKKLPPENIESVTVWKGKESVAKYGKKGENGVVVIITKKTGIALQKVNVEGNNDTKSLAVPLQENTVAISKVNVVSAPAAPIEGKVATVRVSNENVLSKVIISGKIDTVPQKVPVENVNIQNKANPGKVPLYIVDGKVQGDDFSIKTIVPDEIESINVIKDKSAVDKFGPKAVNGVVDIKLKSPKLKLTPVSKPSQPSQPKSVAVAAKADDQAWLKAPKAQPSGVSGTVTSRNVNTKNEGQE